ncbi:outer membrane beta-barrel protein [Mucilaginibacter sp. CAU 1740]|uniref:outer membrane beta-barrel protein n=1 Tax=Mucilaginibacter sp. CAU 1740 TaxID=3140365 RepID=UPI00325A75BD
MKNSLKYSDLWRKKREELPIDAEPQAGWQEMQSLLDLHLPIVPITPAAPVSKLAKVIKAIKAMKATSLLVASLIVATVTGTTIYFVKTQQHKKSSHQHKNTKYAMRTDSLTDSLTANKSNVDSVGIVSDSLLGVNLTGNKKDIAANNDSLNNAAGTNSTINNSGVKAKGIVSSGAANGKQAVSTRLGNGYNTNGSLTGYSGYPKSGNVVSVKHLNNSYSAGNGIAQLAVTDTTKTSAQTDIQDDLAVQNNSPLTIPSTISTNGTQSRQSTGINPLLFQPQIFARQPLSSFVVGNYYYNRLRTVTNSKTSKGKNLKLKNQSAKSAKTKSSGGGQFGRSLSAAFSNTDWGILLGANTSGSFTPTTQNHNFYGSFPIDLYIGLFATYHINDKWGLNAQVRFLTPLNLSGTYTNQNDNVDSVKSIRVTDARKAYFVTIPIHAVYKINDNISIKGGPVINVLAKQVGLNTSAQKMYLNVDTLFLQNKDNQVKTTTRYDQKINLGLSGGISVQANRFIFEALYQKSLSGYNVISDFHNYKNNPGSLQLSVGFKLNGTKHH